MASLREHLARFLSVPGVRAVVLAGRDGLSIETAGRGDPRVFEALGALGASALSTTEALGQELSAGAPIGVVQEFDATLVSVDPVGDYALIVTLCDNAGSLGRVRNTLRTVYDDLLRALDA